MKQTALAVLLCGLVVSALGAESELKIALKNCARKLADQPNYSWTAATTIEGVDWQPGPVEGQTEKDGYTYLKFTLGDRTIESAFKGTRSALKRDDAWESAEELGDNDRWIARRLQTFKPPAGEAAELADMAAEFRKEADGAYTARLTDDGLKQLFYMRSRGTGSERPAPKDGKGWVKFWLKEGALLKYQYHVEGKVAMGQDQEERHIIRTVTTEIKAVGSTKVSVPDAARKKLS